VLATGIEIAVSSVFAGCGDDNGSVKYYREKMVKESVD
jgi:hypothetical protein